MKTKIKTLGDRKIQSPLCDRFSSNSSAFVEDDVKILSDIYLSDFEKKKSDNTLYTFEKAGPRKNIFFDPSKVKSAIVTCGGLCPGLNDVIRALVMGSYYGYGAKNIIGIPYGYSGLLPEKGFTPIELNPEMVDEIHKNGGTILGSSRGGTDDMESLVDSLERMNINILYAIGGDGTLKGAHRISQIAQERGLTLSVIGIPKTIDNDISYIEKSFGFESAFSRAVEAISSAHIEAKGAPNGIGLVKLMGRHSGYIAANASLAMNDANFILIPEVPFDLDGPNGFLAHLEKRISERDHALICVAEGAGQDILVQDKNAQGTDASGNVKLADIGLYLKDKINDYFNKKNIEVNLKYIDPSYMIRSAPATPNDSVFCGLLGQYSVHAAMAGKTDLIVGKWHNEFTHIPIKLVTSERKKISPDSSLWYNVLQASGQPVTMKNQ